jgi:hypothetical protein
MDDNFIAALEICGIMQDQPLMEAVTIVQGISDVQTVIALTNKEFDQLTMAINKMEPDPLEFDLDEMQWGLTRMAYEERCKAAEPSEQKQLDNLEHIGFDV